MSQMSLNKRGKCPTCPYHSELCDKIAEIELKKNRKYNATLTYHSKGQSLCWCCKKAVPKAKDPNPCPWASRLYPVDGWDADLKDIDGNYSYVVHKCLMFERGNENLTKEESRSLNITV